MFTIPDIFWLLLIFVFALIFFVIDIPILLENLSLRKDRHKYFDKIHKQKREIQELKSELKVLEKNYKNDIKFYQDLFEEGEN